jgi:hypothetical protein
MKAVKLMIGGGIAAAALATAAPAAAQYYPGYGYGGYGYPYGGNVVGQVINQVLGGGYGGYGAYGYGYGTAGNSRVAASQCTAAVQQRMGGYAGYGYGGYAAPISITSVEVTAGGGYKVRGVTNAAAGYGGYGQTRFSCRTDFRGLVTNVSFGNGYNAYGYGGYNGYNYGDPYAAYGYRRY